MEYQEGKIYKIIGNGLTYYGSTIQTLSQRKRNHKVCLNCKSKIIIEMGNWEIVLVELFPCNTKQELLWRERWYIENNECINILIPIVTNEETKNRHKKYREEHTQKIKNYFQINKEKIAKQIKEKINCDCGSIISKNELSKHKKTKKHINFINQ